MIERFRRREAAPETGARTATTTTDETRVAEEERADRRFAHDEHGSREAVETGPRDETVTRDETVRRETVRTGVAADTMRTVRARQREEFGGINWGAAFFGWLSALGLAAILTGLVVAAGTTLTLTDGTGDDETLGLAGGIAMAVVALIAYFAGGYVAGRMSRFDGARQGLGVWLIALAVTIVLAVAGTILGAEYNVLEDLDLPRIPVDEGDLAAGAVIALLAGVVASLLAAMAGGKAGERYHRRVDRLAIDRP